MLLLKSSTPFPNHIRRKRKDIKPIQELISWRFWVNVDPRTQHKPENPYPSVQLLNQGLVKFRASFSHFVAKRDEIECDEKDEGKAKGNCD